MGWFISYEWLAGEALCKLTLFCWMMIMNSSSNIVAVIAIERLKNVCELESLWTDKNKKGYRTVHRSRTVKVPVRFG